MSQKVSDKYSLLCDLRGSIPVEMNSIVLLWIKNSIEAGTYQVFNDEMERPAGYVIWANVNREAVFNLVKFGFFPRYFYEWTEGNITLILDVLMCGSRSKTEKNQFYNWLKSKRVIAYVRENNIKLYMKNKGFFRKIDSKLLFKYI